MKRKTKIIFLLLCMITVLFSACGAKETDTSDDPEETPEVHYESQPEITPEPTQAENPEPVPEEIKPTPWAEENNIPFSIEEVEVPFYSYAELDNEIITDIAVSQLNATYYVPTVTVSDADEEGNVVYTIQYTFSFPYYAEVPAHISTFSPRYIAETFYAMDYYTGTVFTSSDLTGDNAHSYDVASTFEWDGTSYTVSVAESGEGTLVSQDNYYISDTHWQCMLEYAWNNQMTIIAPKDYDGLVLYLDRKGINEFMELNTEIEVAHIFGEKEDEIIENGLFISLNDLISE